MKQKLPTSRHTTTALLYSTVQYSHRHHAWCPSTNSRRQGPQGLRKHTTSPPPFRRRKFGSGKTSACLPYSGFGVNACVTAKSDLSMRCTALVQTVQQYSRRHQLREGPPAPILTLRGSLRAPRFVRFNELTTSLLFRELCPKPCFPRVPTCRGVRARPREHLLDKSSGGTYRRYMGVKKMARQTLCRCQFHRSRLLRHCTTLNRFE